MKHKHVEEMGIMFIDGDICIYGDDELSDALVTIPIAKLLTPTDVIDRGLPVYPCLEFGQYWSSREVPLPEDYEPLYPENNSD